MCIHRGFDLPMNHHGFGAVGMGQMRSLVLAAGWMVTPVSDFRQEHYVFALEQPATLPIWKPSVEQKGTSHPGNSAAARLAKFCSTFLSPVDNEFSDRLNLGLAKTTTDQHT